MHAKPNVSNTMYLNLIQLRKISWNSSQVEDKPLNGRGRVQRRLAIMELRRIEAKYYDSVLFQPQPVAWVGVARRVVGLKRLLGDRPQALQRCVPWCALSPEVVRAAGDRRTVVKRASSRSRCRDTAGLLQVGHWGIEAKLHAFIYPSTSQLLGVDSRTGGPCCWQRAGSKQGPYCR